MDLLQKKIEKNVYMKACFDTHVSLFTQQRDITPFVRYRSCHNLHIRSSLACQVLDRFFAIFMRVCWYRITSYYMQCGSLKVYYMDILYCMYVCIQYVLIVHDSICCHSCIASTTAQPSARRREKGRDRPIPFKTRDPINTDLISPGKYAG